MSGEGVNLIREKKREFQQTNRKRIKENPVLHEIHLFFEQTRQSTEPYKERKRIRESSEPYKERKRIRESSIEYKLNKQACKQQKLCGNISNLDGFGLYPNSINKDLRNELLGYLKGEFSDVSTRNRSRNEAAITQHDYGKEFIIQTRAFCAFVLTETTSKFYTRASQSMKYSIPINSGLLESEKQRSVLVLSKLVPLIIPQVRDLVLYLVQCIVYDGASSRGPHIDGTQNAGDVIVGCDIGGGERSFGIGKDHIFKLGKGSIYVMYDNARYKSTHDPKKLNKRETPYVIMFRYGIPKV